MAERAVYCTNCGSMVKAGDRFCGVCGATVSPNAPDASGSTKERSLAPKLRNPLPGGRRGY